MKNKKWHKEIYLSQRRVCGNSHNKSSQWWILATLAKSRGVLPYLRCLQQICRTCWFVNHGSLQFIKATFLKYKTEGQKNSFGGLDRKAMVAFGFCF